MQHIKNIVMILFVVLLAGFHVSACSSAANSQQIAKELADELTDAFDFDNAQIVDGTPPEGDLGSNAPQINSGETENELTLGEPFVLTLYSNFETPEEVDRVIIHVVNSKKYIVLKRGLITRPDQNFIRIGGLIRENSVLKNNEFALHISLMTKNGVLGKPFIWKLDVSNRDAIIPDKSELSDTLESGDWNNDGKPEGDIADDAPQIARIIAPEIMPLNVARNIMIFTNNINDGSEIAKVILATLSSDGFLVRDDFEVTGAEGGFFFKLPIIISNADLLNTKVILNLALQNNDGKTGQYYPWVFLVTRDSIQIDGDTDSELTSDGDISDVVKPLCDCNTQTDCCPDACNFAELQTVCNSGVDDLNIWTGTCVDGICVDLYSKTFLKAFEKNVSQVKFSPAKEELISVGFDTQSRIKVWRYEEADEPEMIIKGSADGFSPTQFAYDPDGKSIAIIEEASTVWQIIGYDLIAKSFQFIHFSRTTPTANSLAYSTDGQFLAFAIPDKNQIGFKRLSAIQNVTTVLKTLDNISVQNPREIGFSNSGELLWADYSADTSGAILLYNVSENKTPNLFSPGSESNTSDLVKMSPDGSMFVTTNCLGIGDSCLQSKIIFLNAKDGSVISSLDMPDVVTDIEFSPDGSYIAASYCDQFINLRSVCNQSSIALIVVNSLQTIRLMQKHTDIISDIAFSKDGTKLASGDMLGNIILWDLQPLMPEWFFVCYDDESCNTSEYCNLFTHRCIMDQCADLQDNDNDLSDANPNTTGSDMDDLDCQEGGKLEIGGNEEIDVK